MASNVGIPFTEAGNGLPINISQATAVPGQLVHIASGAADDYVWLWLSNTGDLTAEVRLYKGTNINGYSLDSTITIAPKSGKALVEPGILLTGGIELRAYVLLAGDSQRPVVIASGHVYRRVD